MKIINRKSIALSSVLLVSLLIGTLTGAGIAYASDIYKNPLSSGWNYIGGTQSLPSCYSYSVDCWEWMQADKTRVDFDSIRYYSGWGDGQDPTFGMTYVYDEYMNDCTSYSSFMGNYINGINKTLDPTDWVMDSLSVSNNTVFIQQCCYYAEDMPIDYVISFTQ